MKHIFLGDGSTQTGKNVINSYSFYTKKTYNDQRTKFVEKKEDIT